MERDYPLISVVICAYNVEQYIARCLQSVLSQTYENLEILCIDDCSCDKTGQILEKIAQGDSRVRVIRHENNLGLSEARNSGIRAARGKYISFIDGDDEIKSDMYEQLEAKFSDEIDVVWFGIQVVYESHNYMKKSDDKYYEIKESGQKMIGIDDLLDYDCSACNKLFRREQLTSEFYFKGRHYEDALFFMKFFSHSKRIYFEKEKLYVYYRRPSSIMASTFNGVPGLAIQHLFILDDIYNYWLKTNLLPCYKEQFCKIFFAFFNFALKHSLPYEKATVVSEASQRLRSWDFGGGYTIPILNALYEGSYEIVFSPSPHNHKLSGLQRIFSIHYEKDYKTIRIFTKRIFRIKRKS